VARGLGETGARLAAGYAGAAVKMTRRCPHQRSDPLWRTNRCRRLIVPLIDRGALIRPTTVVTVVVGSPWTILTELAAMIENRPVDETLMVPTR
jgi:hypothetical protein